MAYVQHTNGFTSRPDWIRIWIWIIISKPSTGSITPIYKLTESISNRLSNDCLGPRRRVFQWYSSGKKWVFTEWRIRIARISYGNVAGWLGGWLGVCHSRYCIKTTKPILKLFRPSGSPIIEAFTTPCADTKFQGEPLHRGLYIHGGRKNWRFSTDISVYLGNGVR